MPTTITEVSQFTSSVAIPSNGEAANSASILQYAQVFADRSQYLKDHLTNGTIQWTGELSNAPGSADIIIGPIIELYLGSLVFGTSANSTLTTSGLSADTWYYVYAYNNAGSIAFEAVTTAPDAARRFKSATTTHRYLGTFRTITGPAILPFRTVRGHHVWRRSGVALSEFRVVTNATDTSYTDAANLPTRVPPHARLVQVELQVNNGTASETAAAFIRTNGDTTASAEYKVDKFDSAGLGRRDIWIETDSSNLIEYKVFAGAGTPETSIYVIGWQE